MPFSPYVIWLFGVAVLLFWAAILVWRRGALAHEPLGLTLSAGGWWALLYALELTAQDDANRQFWFFLKHIGITTISPWWVLFVLEYTHSAYARDKRLIFTLTALSLLSVVAVWSNDWHHLFFRALESADVGGVTVIRAVRGPFFWAHITFTYSLLLVSAIHFLAYVRREGHSYRQRFILLGALLVPWSANILQQLQWTPLPLLDYGPFALAISGLTVTWVLFDVRIMDLVPVTASAIFEAVSDGMILLDANQRVLAINATARTMLGESIGYAIGQPLFKVIPGASRLVFGAPPNPAERVEFQWRDKFFELRRMELASRKREANGHLLVLAEVTARKQSDLERESLIQQLQAALGQSRALYRSSRAVIGLDDLPTQLQAVTDEMMGALGITQVIMALSEPGSRDITLLVQARPDNSVNPATFDDLVDAPLLEQAFAARQLIFRHPASYIHTEEMILAIAPIRYRDQQLGVLIVYDDEPKRVLDSSEGKLLTAMVGHAAIAISNARLFDEVNHLATTDGLTGLYNRRHFLTIAQQTLDAALHSKEPFVVVMLDVDLFKQINDHHGHTTGDEVLRGIADLLRANLRDQDVVGRYGGEEFVILLPNTTLEETGVVAERLRRRVASTIFPTSRGPISTTISLGAVQWTGDARALLTLLDRADDALYQAKNEGRNRFVPTTVAGQ